MTTHREDQQLSFGHLRQHTRSISWKHCRVYTRAFVSARDIFGPRRYRIYIYMPICNWQLSLNYATKNYRYAIDGCSVCTKTNTASGTTALPWRCAIALTKSWSTGEMRRRMFSFARRMASCTNENLSNQRTRSEEKQLFFGASKVW